MSIFTRIIIGCVSSLVILAVAFIILLYRSHYVGAEFSPDDFSARGFTYNKEPMTGFVIRGRVFSDYSLGGLDLVTDGHIKPRYKSPQTWHLVYDNGDLSGLPSHDCDARLLVDYLKLTTDRGEGVWEIWNTDHPKLAKEFWPVVAQMARDEMYLVVSDVMEFGLNNTVTDVDQFKNELDKVAAGAYLKMSEIEFETGELSKAKTLADRSKQFQSTEKVDQLLAKIKKQTAQQ